MKLNKTLKTHITDILKLILFVGFAFITSFFLEAKGNSQLSISMTFILATLFTARYTHGYVYGIAASIIGTVGVNIFFTHPFLKFNITIAGNFVTAVSMFIVSIVTSTVTTRLISQDVLRKKAERETMRFNLLRSVSHDLRTPLTSIIGAANALKENDSVLKPEEKYELYDEITDEARWLYNMVENLLSVTRLSNNTETVHKTTELAEEILSVAVRKLQNYYKDVNVEIALPADMIFVPMDCTLICQVLINLMENSVRHGKSAHYIHVALSKKGDYACFSVTDNGGGISKNIISGINSGEYIAENNDDSSKYMGIGFSVCEAIIKAHGGYMHAENLKTGAKVSFYLPLEE